MGIRVDRSKVSFFRNLPLFAGLKKVELDPVLVAAQRQNLGRAQLVFNPGESARHAFWVASGVVKLGVQVGRGREITLHMHAKGQIFGEGALLSPDAARHARASAHESAAIWAVPCEVLAPLLLLPDFSARLGQIVEDRRRRVERRLALLQRDALSRVAGILLELAEESGIRDSRGVILGLKLTHKEIAGLIGLSRESVSFALMDLRRSALVQVEERRLVLVDTTGLRALAESDRRE